MAAPVKRLVVVIAGVAALVAALVQGWFDVRQSRAFRRLLAEGDAAVAAGQMPAAIEAFSGAVALRPQSMLPYLRRGDTYRRQGRYESAERDLSQARTLDSTAPQPLELEGDARMARGDTRAAAASYRGYLALDDRAPRLQYKLGVALFRSGDLAGATEAARRAIALDPALAQAHQLLGIVALARGQAADASAALTRALELDPASAATRAVLADLYASLGRTRDEIAHLEAAAVLDASRPEGLVALALGYDRHGRHDFALTTLERADERFPRSAVVGTAAARLWLTRGPTAPGGEEIRRAVQVLGPLATESASGETLALYGRALLLKGELIPARDALVRATTRLPVPADAFLDLAVVEARLGHVDAARLARARHDALADGR
jgi:tetratricopeptide (TPR) repeat protein